MNQRKDPKGGSHTQREKGPEMKGIKDTQSTIQNVNIKLDPVVKGSAEGVLSGMGLSMSAYVGMCLRQLAQDRRVPFAQTVDPDFWVAEAKVNAAKAHIDSGAFDAAFGAYDKAASELQDLLRRASAEAISKTVAEFGPMRYEVLAAAQLISDHEDGLDLSSAGKVARIAKEYARELRRGGEAIQGTNADEAVGRMQRFLYDVYADGIEASCGKVGDIIDSAFDANTCLRDVLNRDPSEFTIEEKANAIDDVISTVLDVAEEHTSNLSMRFVGSGGQTALKSVFDALKWMREYREWLSKSGERVRQRKEERERSDERHHQHLVDLIRANGGTPDIQNVTQVMSQPERIMSHEEWIEQAKTAAEVMRILNGEDADEGPDGNEDEN